MTKPRPRSWVTDTWTWRPTGMRGTTRSEPGFDACSSAVIHACTNMSSGRCASSFAIDQFLGNRILSVVVLLRLERWNVCLHVDSRSAEPTSELPSLMRIQYAVFCLKTKKQPTSQHHP